MKTNITLRLDRELVREAKVVAARKDISVSRFLAECLEEAIRKDKSYEAAKRRALKRLAKGLDLGWQPVPRDDLHER